MIRAVSKKIVPGQFERVPSVSKWGWPLWRWTLPSIEMIWASGSSSSGQEQDLMAQKTQKRQAGRQALNTEHSGCSHRRPSPSVSNHCSCQTFLRSVYCVCMSVSTKRLVGHISVTVCALNELRCLMQSTVFAKLPNLQNMQLHWSCILSPRNYIYMLNGFVKNSTFWRQFN